MPPRFNRARLTTSADRMYQRFVAQQMQLRDNQKASRPPTARDLFGGEAEVALRAWLAAQLPLSDKRILEYEERRGNSWGMKYRELDALVLAEKQAHVFEIKASRSPNALGRGLSQLSETAAILRLIMPRVQTTLLFVDTGTPTAADVAAHLADPERADRRPPRTLAEVLADLPSLRQVASLAELDPATTGLLVFSVQDIIDLAGAENLHLHWDEEPVAAAPPEPQAAPAASDDDEDESPLAAALRKALGHDKGADA